MPSNIVSKLVQPRRIGLLLFYTTTLALYFFLLGEHVVAAWQYPDWLVAPIMSLGSFVAGATFLGGGAVAFPALTKILHTSPVEAKNFSLAIQSVGMSSASIYIISRVKLLPFGFFVLYLPGAVIGMLISLFALGGVFSATDLRISFTLFVVCFMVVYLWTIKSQALPHPDSFVIRQKEILLVGFTGVLGGIISGLLGSGADLLAFSILALYFRLDIKRATQCSVIIMASMSIFGTAAIALLGEGFSESTKNLWLLAAPVVLLGAPLGAIFCRRVQSKFLVGFICVIATAEILSTMLLVRSEIERLLFYALLAFAALAYLILLKILASRRNQPF